MNGMTIDPALNLLLISTSTVYGTQYLDHAEEEIRGLLRGVTRILFVPYALADHAAYAEKVRKRFSLMRIEVSSVHEAELAAGDSAAAAIARAEAIFIGGGNSFRLAKALQEKQLLDPIRRRVRAGMPYMGASAGSNIACPTIRTTNDMPIVEPASLEALGLFPWQINPHYVDADPESRHMGETREERLLQYLEENEVPAIGLREGSMVRVKEGEAWLRGSRGARLFRRGAEPEELMPPVRLEI
jgi:dipeptidase E